MEEEIIPIDEAPKVVSLENVRITHLDCTTEELNQAIRYMQAENNKVDEVAIEVEEIRTELVNQEIIPDKYAVVEEQEA